MELLIYCSSDPDNLPLASLDKFITLVKKLGEMFNLKTSLLNVYWEENSTCVAFNSDGNLFFNLEFYVLLHNKVKSLYGLTKCRWT